MEASEPIDINDHDNTENETEQMHASEGTGNYENSTTNRETTEENEATEQTEEETFNTNENIIHSSPLKEIISPSKKKRKL